MDDKDIVHSDSAKKREALPVRAFAARRRRDRGGFWFGARGFGIYAYCPVWGIITSKREVPD
jgi:hypothetical protein